MRYLHHIIFDPLSLAEEIQIQLVAIAIIVPILIVAFPLCKWFYEKFYDN